MPNRNQPAVTGAEAALDQLKFEVASEIGIPNYRNVDRGSLSARENGRVGGNMVRRMIQLAEGQLNNR